ncbi:MAG: MFS transporter [Gammaproteobacteria bacterium]|nr:MFS transporter [Gammaproteobacteria bacterium]MDH3536688.1 MFS transporter [Gammaproteobacteria bacterium]
MSTPPATSISRSQAIVAFTLGTLFFGYAFVQRVSPSVMTGELMREFAVGGAALGSLSAFYFYAYASIQLPVGMLTDRFGPRKLMSFTAALCALASIGFAFSDSLLMASIGRALIGGTVAFAFVGTLAIAGYWFRPAQYALLAGLLQTAGMSGGIFGQAPLRQMVEAIGWRGTINVLAAVALLLAVLLFLLVPKRSSEQRHHGPRRGIMQGLRAVTVNPQTWICSVIGFGMASTMLAFGGLWGVPWLHSVHGYTTTEAAGITSMLFVGWAILSPLCGWASDRIGRRNIILLAGAVITLIALTTLVYATPQGTTPLMALIFTVGAGGSAMTVCFGSVKELNDINYSSTSLGLMNMCIVGSGAVMQPLIGWLLDLNWDGAMQDGARVYSEQAYTTAFISLLVLTLMALLAGLFLRETHCRQIG